MDELAESDKTDAAVKAYLTVKADLAKPLGQGQGRGRQVEVEATGRLQDQPDRQAPLRPDPLRGGRRRARPSSTSWRTPSGRTTTGGRCAAWPCRCRPSGSCRCRPRSGEDFAKLRTNLTASPSLADSFFARRESVSVFSSLRTDRRTTSWRRRPKPWWDAGYNRHELLSGQPNKGMPKTNRPPKSSPTPPPPRSRAPWPCC